eukprot:COSAG02_NODE_2874_length_7845_cov_4.528660_4_plen_109_part_00
MFVAELCVLRTFGVSTFHLFLSARNMSLNFIWDRLPASIQFPVMTKRAQYARFSGECTCTLYCHGTWVVKSSSRPVSSIGIPKCVRFPIGKWKFLIDESTHFEELLMS